MGRWTGARSEECVAVRELRLCCVRSGNGSWRDLGSGFAGEVEGVIWALSSSSLSLSFSLRVSPEMV